MAVTAEPSKNVLVAEISYAVYRARRYGVTEASVRLSVDEACAEAERQNVRDAFFAYHEARRRYEVALDHEQGNCGGLNGGCPFCTE